ncbi:LysM peptidoglycan-binding domain-containing protein [Staphylococcus nepalensis]|nr:LysM peptidoglycan-binding domain-containing protein [Staphylococcus nepalensis]PNZ98019.1 hypothetical protein CD130_06780 [Staphylococcus nepalensis]GGB94502.1 hypothetical protein GCM10007203_26940 [Staphylococcus nepalensis]VDG69134.1 peptidoglycan binding domain-containing protein [Lacrimispora indolis]
MAFISYTVQSGDNLTSIANEFDTNIQNIQNYNSIINPDNINVGDVLKIPSESTHVTNYVIQYGDNLNSIANKFGTTPDRLQSLNNIVDPDYIQVGQTIQVSGSQNESNQSSYTVQYGDSLESIANKFGTTVDQLQSLNNIANPDYIQVGQTIQVSGSQSNNNQTRYTVQYGDSLEIIANKFGTTVDQLQSLNNIANPNYIQVGQTIQVSGSQGDSNQSTYTIQYGDTLENIANKFGTTVSQLQTLNNIANPDYIQVGQVLTVDGEAKTNSSNVSKYTVQSGDNLSVIAQKFNSSVSELQSLNDISNPDYLQVGQEILVPGNYDTGNDTGDDTDNSENNGGGNNIPPSNGDKVTEQQLIAVGWPSSAVTETVINDLNDCLEKYEINTKSRVMHFISQCSHESVAGTYREEIASGEAYEGRTDIGNTQPGDGPKFKGGGYLQMTGRANYTQFANSIGDQEIVNQGVSYVADNYPWTSAGFWWYTHGMNQLCDTNPSVEQVTLKVNGGYNGLADRKQYYQKCVDVFSNYGESPSSSEKGSAAWLNQYRVTAEYGYYDVNINNNMHYGMDFGLFTGTPVKAITSGTVLETKWNPGGGGNTITIKEDDDKHYQWYMHLSEYNVKSGQSINTGDVIAYSGASGEGVTGPHLHFQRMVGEVSNQAAENPREFLEQLGLNSQ